MADYAFRVGDRVKDGGGVMGTVTHRKFKPFHRYRIEWDTGVRSWNGEATLLRWAAV